MIFLQVLAFLLVVPIQECQALLSPLSSSRAHSQCYPTIILRNSNNKNDFIYESDSNEPSVLPEEAEPIRTLGGGADMIFEMARQMLLWEETAEEQQQQQQSRQPPQQDPSSLPSVLPRWRPIRGVSDANPSFRTSAPLMNSQGYAGTIWRNVRKANKPSLWRHALRTYDRMGQNTATSTGASNNGHNGKLKVQRTNLHHEGALVACAKLGLWKKALEIYKAVQEEEKQAGRFNSNNNNNRKVFITDNMVLSLIRSCVRGSKQHQKAHYSNSNNDQEEDESLLLTLEQRRAPLDECLAVLLEMEEQHGLPLVARHMNPIAAAYQKLGLTQEAFRLIETHLQDRTKGPEEEDGDDPFNVNDVRAKDKGSYSLLVKSAVSEGNWEGAVEALKTMTEAGLYPNSRNLNAWTEVSERKSRQRNTRSWKKKRDEYWLESVR